TLLWDSVRRAPASDPIAHIVVKVIVFDGLVADIRRGHDMHEHIVTDFNEVAEPHHRLRHMLSRGQRRHSQHEHTQQCYVCQPSHGWILHSVFLSYPAYPTVSALRIG